MPFAKDGILFDNEELSREILAGLRDKFPEVLSGVLSERSGENTRTQRAARVFRILLNTPKPNPFRQ
jgi:hypothetical protein